MQIQLKTLLASSLLVLTALSASAEQPLYYGPQGATGGMGQVPIAWGDCVPVPVNPGMMYPGNMPMGMNSMPPLPPMQGMMPPQNLEPVFLAPPSPFFNGTAPAPMMPPQVAMPSCNNNSVQELQALQLRYKRAASASKMKIQELIFMLEDAKSQITSTNSNRDSLEKKLALLSSAENSNKKKSRDEAIELKKKLDALDDTNKSLLTKIKLLERDAGAQARKLTGLEQSAKELTALQSAYKERNNENAVLKNKLTAFDDKNKTLTSKLGTLENESGAQARKLTALGQSATELTALQSAYKERSDENVALKAQLASLGDENKTLITKFGSLETESGNQARKLTALGQSALELTALQSAYRERNDENVSLKAQLAKYDDENKTLKTKFGLLETESGNQARKITALGQSSTELTALQSAYKERNDENVSLKEQLAKLDDENATLKQQLTKLEADVSEQRRAFDDAMTEISTLNLSYSKLETEQLELNRALSLASTDTDKDGVFDPSDSCPSTAEGTVVDNKGCADDHIPLLTAVTSDLNKLKASYGELLRQKTDLNHELIIATSDDDKDGVVNPSDTCPTSADGTVVNIKGCPDDRVVLLTTTTDELAALKASYGELLRQKTDLNHELIIATSDDDKDGVVNPSDTCPTSADGTVVNIKGCADDRVALLATTSDELAALKASYGELLREKNGLNHDLIIATSDDDKDGVVNLSDKCPTTALGIAVNITGCVADSDNDGVANAQDKCPASPAGSAVNSMGCPVVKDGDADGIVDAKDKCPTSPRGSRVNAEGCPPIMDGDSDGVADANDLCPSSATGASVNAFGCTASENITLKGVNFNTGSANLTSASLPILNAAANTLKKASNPRVEIGGYTDNQGSASLNKGLSQRRANAVMIHLIKKGVDATSLSATGYGEASPVASNSTKQGRATNRRVELKMK